MSGGNGIDIAAVYQLLTQVAGMVADQGRRLDGLNARLEAVERRLGALEGRGEAQAAELAAVRRAVDDIGAGLASLRRAVTEYHSSVIGHGILITELDERVRRIEQHLNLPQVG